MFGTLPGMAAGNRFAAKTLLRFAVALLGLQLTIHELADLGVVILLVVLAVFIATFVFTKWLGRLLGVDRTRRADRRRYGGVRRVRDHRHQCGHAKPATRTWATRSPP